MESKESILGPYFSKLPTELILEIGWSICTSSQKNYITLLLTCQHLHDLCRLTCLPAVPVVLNNPSAAARFAEYLASDSTIAPRVHRLWLFQDHHEIIIKCPNLVSLACDGYDLVSICCGNSRRGLGGRSSPPGYYQAQSRPKAATFVHTRLEDVAIMGLWDFWTRFASAPFAPVLCAQLRRLWLLDHLFLYQMDLGWLSSLKELAYWSIDLSGDQGRFRNERALLKALPGLVRLRVLMWSATEEVVKQAKRVEKLELMPWIREQVEAWLTTMAAGSIYPFTDKNHFESTYRTICHHKNIQLDLAHLPIDLHQLHLLVFNEGGEAKVIENDLWEDISRRIGFSPSAVAIGEQQQQQQQQQQQRQQPTTASSPSHTPTSPATATPASSTQHQLSRLYKLYLTFFDLAIQENIAQNRARAQAAMQATSAAAAATATHSLIPHGIPLVHFLTHYVGLPQAYVDGITAQQRFLLLEWTQLSEDELKDKMKVPDNVVDVVVKVRDKLKEMKDNIQKPSTVVPPPSLAHLPPPPPGPLQTGVRFISSGLKGEPLPPPEPKMGSKNSFDVVYKLILESKITEDSLDRTLDSIIVPAEKLPEHHALLDKVSQACTEIDAKLAMIHDVLQQENYIKRMIIIASQIVYQKTLLTKPDWERRYVLTVDMLKSMLAEIQYLVGLYNQKIRGLMDAFQSTASQHGHDAAVQQLPSWVQVQLQQQAQQAQQAPPPPGHLSPEEYAAMSPQERLHARQTQRAQEAEAEIVRFREGFQKEGPEEVIRWVESRCRPLKSVYEEYLEQRRVLEERLREREREKEEEEEEKRYSALGRRRWSLREEIDYNKNKGVVSKRIKVPVKPDWSVDGTLGLPFTEEEHAAAVLFVQCATQEFGALPATAQMLSWDTDLTPEEITEYHRLHDKGYRQYQEYGPKTALLHLLMGQDSTTKRFIVIGYVLSYQQHVFATGTKRYILTLDQLEEWVEDYGDIIEEFIERKNAMHREQVEAHMRSMGRVLDLSGVDIGMLNGAPVGPVRKNRNKNNKKKKKKKVKSTGAEEDDEGEDDEEDKMVDVLVGVVDFLEMYRNRM